MKKQFIIGFLLISLIACKKEEEPAPTPPTATVPTVPDISLKLDSVLSSCSDCSYAYKSGILRGITFNLPSSSEPILLNFSMRPLPGSYPFVKPSFSANEVTFQFKRQGTYYTAVTGSINVTESDTNSYGEIKKMKATFSFISDTLNNKHYKATEGVINFEE
ncbi:MAG: hypothetical protein MUF75_06120 [Bacteroidia bacterium]|jgi:hypothetical protein|nr:hypothetical protein [Bacteroidia bacterium]